LAEYKAHLDDLHRDLRSELRDTTEILINGAQSNGLTKAWWANTADNTPQKASWLEAGWRTRDLNLSAGRVLFVREAIDRCAVPQPYSAQTSSWAAARKGRGRRRRVQGQTSRRSRQPRPSQRPSVP